MLAFNSSFGFSFSLELDDDDDDDDDDNARALPSTTCRKISEVRRCAVYPHMGTL